MVTVTERVSKANMARTLAAYAAQLAGYGIINEHAAARITWGAPYGQVMYVYVLTNHEAYHDVPGFTGSSGSGFVTLREGYGRVRQAMRTISDAFAAGEWDSEKASRVRAAVLAAHNVKA